MSYSKTSLLSGLIWAAWHSPLLLFADYNVGTNRWYALACFSFTCISMSFMLAWFRLKSDSVWPAVLFHASHNVFFPIVFDNLTRNTGHTLMYTTVFGAAPACTSALFALYFWSRREEVELASSARINIGLVLNCFPQTGMSPVVIATPLTEGLPTTHMRQSEQIATPQSAHAATAGLLHGVPTSRP